MVQRDHPLHSRALPPVAVAYKAGYSHDGRLLRTTLKYLPGKVGGEEEQFLGIIYIGDGAK